MLADNHWFQCLVRLFLKCFCFFTLLKTRTHCDDQVKQKLSSNEASDFLETPQRQHLYLDVFLLLLLYQLTFDCNYCQTHKWSHELFSVPMKKQHFLHFRFSPRGGGWVGGGALGCLVILDSRMLELIFIPSAAGEAEDRE